ncbi:restriction endonuclease, SacI family [Pseudomonas rhodesiae]|uniref:restriction endonuclease, SacI family n=1 Tax=Pseudomonas rhodesiae TaxID=76760 RepID=UPI0009E20008|nr:restriction endonuclease, SacI family [Pseudomonas rhodesiae]
MDIDKHTAEANIRFEVQRIQDGAPVNQLWLDYIDTLSKLCQGAAQTHIAFIGTEILAKSVDDSVDLYAIKPTHAQGNIFAYSARSLCHSVLVPLSAEMGFHIGVTGREPLNNQPYFRMTKLGDGTPISPASLPAFNYMLSMIAELSRMTSAQAKEVLRAFIFVRLSYQPRYTVFKGNITVTSESLSQVIKSFVEADSEHGRRAQAAVAGLMDIAVGQLRVESGRINDPSRNSPGDVCIRRADGTPAWEKAFEVRDKPVSINDVQIFGKKCVDMGVREASLVMVSGAQPTLDKHRLNHWADHFGIGISLFYGWDEIVNQALFWSPMPKPQAAIAAAGLIALRLQSIEVSVAGVALWQSLTSQPYLSNS